MLVIGVTEWAHERDMKPLKDRAWAFQEWLLSKRLLHINRDQVRWECYCLAASEVYPEGRREDDLRNLNIPAKSTIVLLSAENENGQYLWERIRQEYSTKRLTKAEDKLAAFSGVARMAHKVLRSKPSEYLAGLWAPTLLQDLLWQRYGDEVSYASNEPYIAPTWSWASLNGPYLNYNYWQRGTWLVKIMASTITPVEDIFGPVSTGNLVIECTLCSITLVRKMQDARYYRRDFYWKVAAINGTAVVCGSKPSLDDEPSPAPDSMFVRAF